MSNKQRTVTYLDTCVFLWFFNNPSDNQEAYERHIIVRTLLEEAERNERQILTSMYTKIEVAYLETESSIRKLEPDTIDRFDSVLDNVSLVSLVNVTHSVAQKAREVVRSTMVAPVKSIKPKDAIHVASALTYGATELFTYDEGLCKWNGNPAINNLTVCHPYVQNKPLF